MQGSDAFLITVIVPVYNEEAVLPMMLKRLEEVATSVPEARWEFLFVSDGSTDRTLELLKDAHQRDPRVSYLQFSRNFGHQAAVSAGLAHAKGDVVAVIDGDLQDPPELIVKFIKKWREGFLVVYGVRQKREKTGWRQPFYRLFY